MITSFALIVVTTTAGTVPQPVQSAIEAMQAKAATQCSFERTFSDGEKQTVELYDADEARWTLLSVGDASPTPDELEDYAAESEARASRSMPFDIDFEELAQPDTFLTEQNAKPLQWQFRPVAEDDDEKDIVESLLGTVTLDPVTQAIASILVENTATFSPAMGVKIKTMNQKFVYRWLADQETYALGEVRSTVQGRAFGLKKIDQDVTITFSQFDCS